MGFSLLPREYQFFDLFDKMADTSLDAARRPGVSWGSPWLSALNARENSERPKLFVLTAASVFHRRRPHHRARLDRPGGLVGP